MHLPTRRSILISAVLLFFLLLVPVFGGTFVTYLASVAMIFGVFALAYDLLYGYTGLVSFGHAVFYGVPAYVVGIFTITVFDIKHPVILIGLAVVSGAFLGALVGFFCTFTRGIYLALVTFAFAEVFSLLVLTDPGGITYGENGIMAVRPPPLHVGGLKINLFGGEGLYYLTLGILLASYLVLRSLTNSQIGDILKGIKQNEERLLSLGYNTRPYKIVAFALSGIFSAISGTLMIFVNNSIAPAMVEWHVGARILLITILGGPGTLLGPIIGSFLVVFTEHYASSWIGGGTWLYVLGGMYICVVLFLPGGIFNTKWVRNLLKE